MTVGSVLVVGAGIAGMQASLDLAESGYKVYLVERAPSIGGNMIKLDKTFPTGDCAMCTIAPKMVGVGRNPDIEKITVSEVVSVTGEAGNFEVTVRKKPRYVTDDCNGCGWCSEVCPVKVPNYHDAGIGAVSAISIPFPQAVPLQYYINKEHCINCGKCQMVCLPNAVNLDDQGEEVVLNVGAIIVSTGYELFDPTAMEEYGYGRHKNVITNMQFERLLSPSGPTGGHVIRPSDGEKARHIAFIQCVGSRNVNYYPYCSRVCCMVSTKQATVAHEHDSELKSTILYMDMRSFGKGFQEYVDKAKDAHGVKYIRGRPALIEEGENNNLVIHYEDTEKGEQTSLEVDIVVLAAALKPASGAEALSKILGIAVDEFGYFEELTEEEPFDTLRPGIYINGTCQGPKDIPDSVSQASGAASKAEALLKESRKSLLEVQEFPKEKKVEGAEPRVGVFICHCGLNIASVVDVHSVAEYAKTLDNVAYATSLVYTCSTDNQKDITEAIRSHDLNRVVIAACTPRGLAPLFRHTCQEAGLNPYLFEMANIREHCSWVHIHEPEKATEKAKDLVRMAVAKARLLTPEKKGRSPVLPNALVIGGGIAGMRAALDIADQGFDVKLVEKEAQLGGSANHRYSLLGKSSEELVEPMRKAVEEHPSIEVFLNSVVDELKGYTGNFEAQINHDGSKTTVKSGAILVATGSRELKPTVYHYGDENVMTQEELEDKLNNNFEYKDVVMIQCVGARNEERPYCSRSCCADAVKNAMVLKERRPDSNVYVLYRDMMTFGMYELDYKDSKEMGVKYIRYSLDSLPEVEKDDGKYRVKVLDSLLGKELVIEADTLVLSTPQIPPEGIKDLQKILRVPTSPDGFFMEAHPKLRPLEFTSDGIYLCGKAQGPKELSHAIAQASGAAARVCALLSKEIMETEANTAIVAEDLCIGCGRCVETCVFNAITLEENEAGEFKSRVNPAMCKGCGACAAVCPNGAITPRQFASAQIVAMIDELLEA
ncbi:MAG: CoB--CoM heterodisulfide reductase iron-sulfur subunit A family protein [Candidatus Hydrothermarchaeales archaeon]